MLSVLSISTKSAAVNDGFCLFLIYNYYFINVRLLHAQLQALRCSVLKTGQSLADYLSKRVFGGQEGVTEDPVPADVEGFDQFLKRYNEGLAIERAAVEHL